MAAINRFNNNFPDLSFFKAKPANSDITSIKYQNFYQY